MPFPLPQSPPSAVTLTGTRVVARAPVGGEATGAGGSKWLCPGSAPPSGGLSLQAVGALMPPNRLECRGSQPSDA